MLQGQVKLYSWLSLCLARWKEGLCRNDSVKHVSSAFILQLLWQDQRCLICKTLTNRLQLPPWDTLVSSSVPLIFNPETPAVTTGAQKTFKWTICTLGSQLLVVSESLRSPSDSTWSSGLQTTAYFGNKDLKWDNHGVGLPR